MPTDREMAEFCYSMLRQMDLKTIDWNAVAARHGISNGHAARMRFSRFRNQIEENNLGPPSPPASSSSSNPISRAQRRMQALSSSGVGKDKRKGISKKGLSSRHSPSASMIAPMTEAEASHRKLGEMEDDDENDLDLDLNHSHNHNPQQERTAQDDDNNATLPMHKFHEFSELNNLSGDWQPGVWEELGLNGSGNIGNPLFSISNLPIESEAREIKMENDGGTTIDGRGPLAHARPVKMERNWSWDTAADFGPSPPGSRIVNHETAPAIQNHIRSQREESMESGLRLATPDISQDNSVNEVFPWLRLGLECATPEDRRYSPIFPESPALVGYDGKRSPTALNISATRPVQSLLPPLPLPPQAQAQAQAQIQTHIVRTPPTRSFGVLDGHLAFYRQICAPKQRQQTVEPGIETALWHNYSVPVTLE